MLSSSALPHAPKHERGATNRAERAPWALPRWLRAALGVPMIGKLAGANILIVLAIAAMTFAMHGTGVRDRQMVAFMALALLVSFAVSMGLVAIALRPLGELEALAARVLAGDLNARVAPSLIADRELAGVGRSLNMLLASVEAEHGRMQRLATYAVRSQDQQAVRVAHELHDSVAQVLTGLMLQLSAVARDCTDEALRERLEDVRAMAVAALEDIRSLSQDIHPQVLDDLGLGAAVERLARQTRERHALDVEVLADPGARGLPPHVATVLYRVVAEAVENAVRHAKATQVVVTLRIDPASAMVDISDDGDGFDVTTLKARGAMGIFALRERVALVDGRFDVSSRQGGGTRVSATVPIFGQGAA